MALRPHAREARSGIATGNRVRRCGTNPSAYAETFCQRARTDCADDCHRSVRTGGGLTQAIYDFDQEGYTMKPLDPRWRTAPPPASERLPILVGVQAGDVQLGRPAESPQIQAALKLLQEFGSFADGGNSGNAANQRVTPGDFGSNDHPGRGSDLFASPLRHTASPLAPDLRSISKMGKGNRFH